MDRIIFIGVVCLLLGSCTSERTAAISAPFIGTWYQRPVPADQADQATEKPAGYIAISAQQITINVDGIPRGIMLISNNQTDPSLRSGRLIGADGSIIFLGLGESLIDQQAGDVRLLAPTVYLDWYYYAPGAASTGKPSLTIRLWPSAALATASYARQLPSAESFVDRSSTQLSREHKNNTLVKATTMHDQRLLEASQQMNDAYFNLFSEQLLRAKQAGSTPEQLNELYARCIKNCRSDIMSYLDQSRQGDDMALKRVDAQLGMLTQYAVIYREWCRGL